MLIYDISFVDNNSEKHSIPFPIPNTNIEISYGTDGKRYLTLTYKYDNSDEKKEYLNKIQQLNSSLNSDFTISILNGSSLDCLTFAFTALLVQIGKRIKSQYISKTTAVAATPIPPL